MKKKAMIDLKRLETLMGKKGWGIGDLAQYAGVKYDTLYSIKVGRRSNTSAENLRQIAKTLGTSVDYLLGLSDDVRPPTQRLAEPVRQLAEIAGRLSDVRQEELIRIAAALEKFEREHRGAGDRKAIMVAMMEIVEQVRAGASDDDLLESLEILFRGGIPPRPNGAGTGVDDGPSQPLQH